MGSLFVTTVEEVEKSASRTSPSSVCTAWDLIRVNDDWKTLSRRQMGNLIYFVLNALFEMKRWSNYRAYKGSLYNVQSQSI